MRIPTSVGAGLCLVATMLVASLATAATAPETACEAAKNKEAGKYFACRQKAEAKLAQKGDVVKYGEAIAKCTAKFEAKWQKATDKAVAAGTTCYDDPLTDTDFQAVLDEASANVATGLAGGGLQDCPADLAEADIKFEVCREGPGVCGNYQYESCCGPALTNADASPECGPCRLAAAFPFCGVAQPAFCLVGTCSGGPYNGLPCSGGAFDCPSGTCLGFLDTVALTGDEAGCATTSGLTHFDLCPAGLPSKTVFVTSTTTSGAMGGLAGADALCQARAQAASLPGTYKAWLSSATTSAAARLTHAVGSYVRTDGPVIAVGWASLTGGSIVNLLNRDENGLLVTGDVWTNTTAAGNIAAAECAGWTSSTPGHKGTTGSTSATNAAWTNNIPLDACEEQRHLYCVQQ